MAVYWTFTCQCAIKVISQPKGGFVYALQSLACLASNDSLYFPLDDDLGKSDSSSGSMDSIQVGPTFSAECSHLVHLHVELQH